MLKIGFIDNFLSEWHANNYPRLIRNHQFAKDKMDVCYAYAREEVSPYDGVTTDEWCKSNGVERVSSIEELVEKSDCIVVLSPDNPEFHEELAALPLASGKPVYIDKTFAPDKETAQRIFAGAKAHSTPVWSSSALRFATELKSERMCEKGAFSCAVTGPYLFDIYAVHIMEMIVTVMKGGAKRVLATENGRNKIVYIDYGEGRSASFIQFHTDDDGIPFSASVVTESGARYKKVDSDYFAAFIDELVGFFADGRPRVQPEETVEVMALIVAAKKALAAPFTWVEV